MIDAGTLGRRGGPAWPGPGCSGPASLVAIPPGLAPAAGAIPRVARGDGSTITAELNVPGHEAAATNHRVPQGHAQEEDICPESDVYPWYPKALPPARACRTKVESGRILVRECRQSVARPFGHLCFPCWTSHGKRAWSSESPSGTKEVPQSLSMVNTRYK